MSGSIKNVAIFGATGMTGLATLPQAVAAGRASMQCCHIAPVLKLWHI